MTGKEKYYIVAIALALCGYRQMIDERNQP